MHALLDFPKEHGSLLALIHVGISGPENLYPSSNYDSRLLERFSIIFARTSGAIRQLFSYINARFRSDESSVLSFKALGAALHIVGSLADSCPTVLDILLEHGLLDLFGAVQILTASRRPERFKIRGFMNDSQRVDLLCQILTALEAVVYTETYRAPAYALLIRQGLIPSVIGASSLIPVDYADNIAEGLHLLLLHLLPKTFGNRRVLNTFLHSLKKVQDYHGDELNFFTEPKNSRRLNSLHHQQVHDTWEEIVLQASAFKKLRGEFEASGIIVCANPECSSNGKHSEPDTVIRRRRCSRCKVTNYCSESCQKRNWKRNNHREKCDNVCFAILRPVSSDVDEKFLS
ncbi:hypothetical protein D9758_007093 [Tetrapyrgos nigripes]|uniref:MYND-type domain-containing protein n=1 Tax=Tetrapyrgos nigripes TaxID=182062 RepID=A0A8H5GDQ5_9AGAR|nr:hypothetical protein D9758_007093 [Tetrapyrgos nigripes]